MVGCEFEGVAGYVENEKQDANNKMKDGRSYLLYNELHYNDLMTSFLQFAKWQNRLKPCKRVSALFLSPEELLPNSNSKKRLVLFFYGSPPRFKGLWSVVEMHHFAYAWSE